MAIGTLENAVVRLLRERPFYGHFLLNLRREERPLNGKAAGVTLRDGVPLLLIDRSRFDGLDCAVQQGLLEHLVKHLVHLHLLRRKGRNQHDWDIACDLAINPGIAWLPEGAPRPEQFGMAPGLAAEEYYDHLVPPFDIGNLEGSGYGTAEKESAGQTVDTADDHAPWSEADSTPLSLAEEMVRALTRESLRGSDGVAPAEMRDVIDLLLRPPAIPWRQVLRQFVGNAGRVGRTGTWMREHRRFGHDTPGLRKRRRLNLLVGVDVSDSTNQVEMRELFGRELVQIARGREASITVLYANSRVQRVEAFTSAGCVAGRYDGGGFTDLRPVFEYAKKMHPLPAAVIYLTDGLGPAPERMEFPTLWVLTAQGEKPVTWGVELRLEE